MTEKSSTILFSIGGTVIVQITSAGLLFLIGLTLARLLGPVGLGAYEYVDVWIEVLMLFAMLGFDRLLIRYVATLTVGEQWAALRGIIRFARWRTLFAGIMLAVGIGGLITLIFSTQSVQVVDIHQPDAYKKMLPFYENYLVIFTLWLGMIVLPLRVLLRTNQVIMQGFQRTIYAYVPDYLLRPALLLFTVVGLSLFLGTMLPHYVMAVHLGAALIATFTSFFFLEHVKPPEVRTRAPGMHAGELMREAMPLMLISGMSLINLRGGTIVIGTVSNLETVALYSVSVRIASLIAIFLASTSAVVAPRIAALYSTGQLDSLQHMVRWSTRLIALFALPVALGFILVGDRVLGLFGPEFTAAHNALIILTFGQLVNVGTGVVGWIVIMSGHDRSAAAIISFAALFHIAALFVLTPIFGLEGAALGTALTNALGNGMLTLFAYRRLKINATVF